MTVLHVPNSLDSGTRRKANQVTARAKTKDRPWVSGVALRVSSVQSFDANDFEHPFVDCVWMKVD